MTVTRAPEQGRIWSGQAALLVFAVVLPPAILYLPSLNAVAVRAGIDGRLAMLLATVVAMVLVGISWRLALLHPGRTLADILASEWGWVGRLLVGVLALNVVVHGAFQSQAFAAALSITILPRTPVLVVVFFQLAAAVFAARKGIEIIARINQVATPLMLFGLVSLLFLTWRDVQIARLPPALTTSLVDVLRGAVACVAWFVELVILAWVAFPFVHDLNRVARPFFICMGVSGVLLAITLWVSQAVLGIELSRQSIVLVEKVAREIQPIEFFSRIEAIYLAAWQPAAVVEFAILVYAAALMAAQLFGLRDYRNLVLPLGLWIGLAGSFLTPGIPEVMRFGTQVVPVYALASGSAIPLLLLLSSLRHRMEGDSGSGRGG
mgnify:CR=1 FL=1